MKYSDRRDLREKLYKMYNRQCTSGEFCNLDILRDIATMTSNASSGNTALKFSFKADYTISKLMTMTFYYDQQVNTPLLSANSYPTTTRDFGLSLKFSLTR